MEKTRQEERLRAQCQLGGFFLFVLHFLDSHIAKFVGVENFSAVEALDELHIVFARDYPDPGVLANRIHGMVGGKLADMGQIVFPLIRLSTAIFGSFPPSISGLH
jgi:hypothetical protein